MVRRHSERSSFPDDSASISFTRIVPSGIESFDETAAAVVVVVVVERRLGMRGARRIARGGKGVVKVLKREHAVLMVDIFLLPKKFREINKKLFFCRLFHSLPKRCLPLFHTCTK